MGASSCFWPTAAFRHRQLWGQAVRKRSARSSRLKNDQNFVLLREIRVIRLTKPLQISPTLALSRVQFEFSHSLGRLRSVVTRCFRPIADGHAWSLST